MHKNLMPIGRFAKACRLTIKALRHYDDIGLLKPDYVDPRSGYRYYANKQAKKAVMIAMLRSLDLPIATVSKLINTQNEDFSDLISNETQRLKQEVARKQLILRSLDRFSNSGQLAPFEISTRQESAYIVASKVRYTNTERMLKESAELVFDLHNELLLAKRDYQDPVMCINSDPDSNDKIKVTACIGISQPYPKLEQAKIIDIESNLVAYLTLKGPYEELGLAYHALFAWIQDNQFEQCADMREIYLNNPVEVEPDNLLTEVILPVKHAES